MIIPPINRPDGLGVTCIDNIKQEVCTKIIDMHKDPINPKKPARVQTDDTNVIDIETRQVEQWVIADLPENDWLTRMLCTMARQANEEFFHFDICGLYERPVLLKYSALGKYDWHTDLGSGDASTRKVSIVIPLNEEFAGGELCFFDSGEMKLQIGAGDVICFPSFIPHRVKTVLSGERWSLVAWISGSSFR